MLKIDTRWCRFIFSEKTLQHCKGSQKIWLNIHKRTSSCFLDPSCGTNWIQTWMILGMEISTYPTQQDSALATPSFTGNQQLQTTGGFGHLATGTYARYYLLLSWDTYECWIRRMVCQPLVCWFFGYVLQYPKRYVFWKRLENKKNKKKNTRINPTVTHSWLMVC